MRQTSKATLTVAVSAEQVWQTISQGGDVHTWFGAMITACELKGAGVGAQRFCVMANGAQLEERIVLIDQQNKRFSYAVEKHPLLATNRGTTIDVLDLGDRTSEVRWSATYDCTDENAARLDQMLSGLLHARNPIT